MNNRIHRIGKFAHKRLDRLPGDDLPPVIQRSRLLSESGMRIPVAIWDEDNNESKSPWIEGRTAGAHLAWLRSTGELSQWEDLSTAEQIRLLEPLVQLHRADPAGLELRPLDIWHRISPRLRDDTDLSSNRKTDLIASLYTRLREHQAAFLQTYDLTSVPVHGDFHVNQIIVAQQGGEPWLLDLDDMALGQPEFDLGNFIANLVTSADLQFDGVMQDYRVLKAMLCPAYVAHGGRLPEPNFIDFYSAVSLLRRALKFYEAGRSDPEPADILDACETLTCQLTHEGMNSDDRK